MPKTTVFRSLVAVVAILSAAGLPATAAAQMQGFMKIPGLDGEAIAAGHEKEIELVSYTQTLGTAACFKASVIKGLDKASPGLAVLAVTNQAVSPVTVFLTTPDPPGTFTVFTAVLENVTVANLELVEVDGGPTPTERVTLRPRRVTLNYRPRDPGTGKELPLVTTVINCP